MSQDILKNQHVRDGVTLKTVETEVYITYSFTISETLIIGPHSVVAGGNMMSKLSCTIIKKEEQYEDL